MIIPPVTPYVPANAQICLACGYVGPPRDSDAALAVGSIGALFGGNLGIVNSAAMQSRIGRCPVCSQHKLVPLASPGGQHELARLQKDGFVMPVFAPPANNRPLIIGCLWVVGALAVAFLLFIFVGVPHLARNSPSPLTPVARTLPSTTTTVGTQTIVTETVTPEVKRPERSILLSPPSQQRESVRLPEPAPVTNTVDSFALTRTNLANAGGVFTEASTEGGRVYHEPTCPNATPSMIRTPRKTAIEDSFTPAWDCHH